MLNVRRLMVAAAVVSTVFLATAGTSLLPCVGLSSVGPSGVGVASAGRSSGTQQAQLVVEVLDHSRPVAGAVVRVKIESGPVLAATTGADGVVVFVATVGDDGAQRAIIEVAAGDVVRRAQASVRAGRVTCRKVHLNANGRALGVPEIND